MPNHRTHLVAGLVSAAVLAYIVRQCDAHALQTIPHLVICTSFALAGSIFPDIDIDSKMQRMFWPVITGMLLLALLTAQLHLFVALAGGTFFVWLVRHRTITHQFWFVISFPCILAWYIGIRLQSSSFSYLCALFFIVGACSHIVLDRIMSRIRYSK